MSGEVETQAHAAGAPSKWFSDWSHQKHARSFDRRSSLGVSDLLKNYESFNDVSLLREWYPSGTEGKLLEMGCATGEFYRYLKYRYPSLTYAGVDISPVALDRARSKYPQAQFCLGDPAKTLQENLTAWGKGLGWKIVYSKDVMHHQVDPWGFLVGLLRSAEETLILRTRTRDSGKTELDPERSCQYHYDGWMPYLVLNLEELIERIRGQRPKAQIQIYRNHMVLGGRENRYLPRECYLPETGTAETAVGVSLRGKQPGSVRIEDRRDMVFSSRWRGGLANVVRRLRGKV